MKESYQDATHLFEGEVTFGFSGTWVILVEMQRLENINENLEISVSVKPHLENIRTQFTEFEFPEDATPLFPIYDKKGSIWISDPLKSRIWKFDIKDEQFQKFEFDGMSSMMLEMDDDGNVWFVEQQNNKLGKIEISEVPNLSIQTSDKESSFDIKYAHITAPVFTIAIVVSSLFFVKSINDKRRLDEKIT